MKNNFSLILFLPLLLIQSGCDSIMEERAKNKAYQEQRDRKLEIEGGQHRNALTNCKNAVVRASHYPNTVSFIEFGFPSFGRTQGGWSTSMQARDRSGLYNITCYTDQNGNAPELDVARQFDPQDMRR